MERKTVNEVDGKGRRHVIATNVEAQAISQQTVRQRFSPIERVIYVDNKDISQPIVQAKVKVEDSKVVKEVRTNKVGPQVKHQDLKVAAIDVVCMGARGRHADEL